MITQIELQDYEPLKKQVLYIHADKETMAKILAFVADLNQQLETNKTI